MEIKSYAKINLALDVIARLSDNYHALNMIMLLITLHDDITINLNNSGEINIECSNEEVGKTEDNLIYKCLNLLKHEYSISEGFDIKLIKRIPIQAGLGGGSSNAASALIAANELLKLNLPVSSLARLGFKVGADIPFFIFDQHSNVKNKGEIVLPLKQINIDPYILLVKPYKGVSTKEAYTNLDINNLVHIDVNRLIDALNQGDYHYIAKSLFNSLESSSFKIEPSLKKIKQEIIDHNFDCALMSGSGSCIFGFTNNQELAIKELEYFRSKYAFAQIVRLKKGV